MDRAIGICTKSPAGCLTATPIQNGVFKRDTQSPVATARCMLYECNKTQEDDTATEIHRIGVQIRNMLDANTDSRLHEGTSSPLV